ncbi:hypothetical protein GCM10009731_49570 [Streptomyces globosus]
MCPAAFRLLPPVTCVEVFIVTAFCECPRISVTACDGTPAAKLLRYAPDPVPHGEPPAFLPASAGGGPAGRVSADRILSGPSPSPIGRGAGIGSER